MQATKLCRRISSLEKQCEEFLRQEYNLPLDISVKVNNRLSRSLGRFVITRSITNEYKSNRIEFAGFLLREGDDEQVISVLKHECIHYALFTLGRAYKDGQQDFESELRKHGADSTNCIRINRKKKVILDEPISSEVSTIIKQAIEDGMSNTLKGLIEKYEKDKI